MALDRSAASGIVPLIGAAIAAVLYVLGFLGFGWWPLLAGFLAVLWGSLDRARSQGTPSQRRVAPIAVGFLFGCVAYAGGHGWLLRLVDVFLAGNALLGGLLWSLYGLAFAVGFAVYAIVYDGLRRRGAGLATAGIAPWIVLEWMQPWPFPVYSGAGLVDVSPLVQVADLGGPLLLSGLVGTANLALFKTGAWLAGNGPRPLRVWSATAALFGFVVAYGAMRSGQIEDRIEAAESLRVGVVQANLGLLEKRRQGVVSHRRHLQQTRELLMEGPVDLVVWPETAYPRALRGPLPLSGRIVSQGIEVPLLFGATLLEHATGRAPTRYNSALLIGRDGTIRDAYRKNLLIPIAEKMPLGSLLPDLASTLPHAQQFRASQDASALRLEDWRIAVPICYEAVRPRFVRRLIVRAEANLLATLANDAWFGDSQEPRMHLQLARMRAIEHRLYLIRATNSGISAIVDPLGRFVVTSGVLERANLRGVVRRMDERPIYTQLGDWPGPLAAAAILLGVWRTRFVAAINRSA